MDDLLKFLVIVVISVVLTMPLFALMGALLFICVHIMLGILFVVVSSLRVLGGLLSGKRVSYMEAARGFAKEIDAIRD